ncbi:MAG: type II toxin-antitoxin system Phd/YefM family antitoxin [Candidatus Binatia bacterium]
MRKTVGSRELKTRLGTYLQQVQAGATIVVTERGQPVAELRPLALEAKGEETLLAELTALGVLTRQSDEPLPPFRGVRSRGRSLTEAISEDREERG